VEGALGPVSLVAGPFNCQPGGPADALVPARDLVGGRQRQGDLLGREHGQQRARDRLIHAGRGHRPAGGRGQPVTAGTALIGWPLVGVVVGHHRLAAAAADDDALAQRDALTGGAGSGGGVVGGQPGLVGQEVSPGDVALMMVFDQHSPLRPGPFRDGRVHRPVRVEGAAGGVTAEDVRSGIGRILQHSQDTGVGEFAPPQLAGPCAPP
jgi:hypothetical protein